MHNDETIWACLGEGFCSFKVRWKTPKQDFCSLVRPDRDVSDVSCVHWRPSVFFMIRICFCHVHHVDPSPCKVEISTMWRAFATRTRALWQTANMQPSSRKRASTTSTWKQWRGPIHLRTCAKERLDLTWQICSLSNYEILSNLVYHVCFEEGGWWGTVLFWLQHTPN